jgi:hypothetical protein
MNLLDGRLLILLFVKARNWDLFGESRETVSWSGSVSLGLLGRKASSRRFLEHIFAGDICAF